MSQESLVYAINLAIGAILAALMTQHWHRAGRGTGLGIWSLAAWTVTVADVLFAVRPSLPYWAARTVPTLLVTVGQGVMLLGAERTAGRAPSVRVVAGVVAVHAAALAAFLAAGGASGWRTVTNGIVWAALSFAAYLMLQRATPALRRTFGIPAMVFLLHGLFHVLRLSLAMAAAVRPAEGAGAWLQVMGDVEASLFMVALFVGLLAAHLSQRNEELAAALRDVTELRRLLPICAWCHKVRDDRGYWQQVEEYFGARGNVQFTHSICETCARDHFPVTGRAEG